MREEQVKTDHGVMSRADARLKAESELENALVCLMETQDYVGASVYAQLAYETIQAIEADVTAEEIETIVEQARDNE